MRNSAWCVWAGLCGLQAYRAILRHIPAATGMAFVIAAHRVQRIRTCCRSLAGVTIMAVTEVEEGMFLEPNHIYLMPPHTEMTAKINKFVLQSPRKLTGRPTTLVFSCFLSLRHTDNAR